MINKLSKFIYLFIMSILLVLIIFLFIINCAPYYLYYIIQYKYIFYCPNCNSLLIIEAFLCGVLYCCSFCYSWFLYMYACAKKFSASAQTLPLGLQAAPLAPGALFSKQGTKAFSSAEYAAKSSSFSEIQPLHIPES